MITRELSPGYVMSDDCALLWELAQEASIVCVVNFGGGITATERPTDPCRDIARTLWDGRYLSVGARGIGYAGPAVDLEEFQGEARLCNLRWIVPGESA